VTAVFRFIQAPAEKTKTVISGMALQLEFSSEDPGANFSNEIMCLWAALFAVEFKRE
jgi:hypothetical protein